MKSLKITLFIGLFCLINFFSKAINTDTLNLINALKKQLTLCKNDTCRLNTLFQLHYLQQAITGELNEKNAATFDISYTKQAIRLAGELGKFDTLKSLTVDLGYIYDLNKNFDSSFVYYNDCLNLFEATNNYQLTFSIAQNILYNNSMLQNIIEENNKRALEQTKKINLLTYVIIGVLLFLMLFMVYFIFQVRKNNTLLKHQKTQIEYSKNQIDSSINYAQNLQSAILSNEQKLQRCLKNSFVLFLPKDKVSGDFLWSYQEESIKYVAVVDCTGHGVPGALLSIVGHLLLDTIMIEGPNQTPSEILEKLHHAIVKALNQENSEHNRDGMDIALIKINLTTRVLSFSGAHRQLYLVRQNEMLEFKGTRRPLGGTQVKYNKPFVTSTIPMLEEDVFYFYSDGYADQMGGDSGKKLLNANLKKLILKNHLLPMAEQRESLKSEFLKFKGKFSQTDDVLLVGIKP